MKQSTKILILAIVAFLSASSADAKSLKITTDCSTFFLNDSLLNWEFYYAVRNNDVAYREKEGSHYGRIDFFLEFIDKEKNIFRDTVHFDLKTPEMPEEYTQDFVGQNNFRIRNKDYKVNITASDPISGLKKKFKYEIKSKNFLGETPKISDIEILAQLKQLDTSENIPNNSFVKKSLYVLPNPYLTLGGKNPELTAYFEIYDAKKFASEGYSLIYRILDAARNVVAEESFEKESNSDFVQEYIKRKLENFNSGKYYLEVEIEYDVEGRKKRKSTRKKFFLLNPDAKLNNVTRFSENLSYEKSEWAVLSEEQVEEEFEKAKPIASTYENEFYQELTTVEAKKRFLFRFWKTRNPDTSSAINQALYEYRKRIDKANREFSTGTKKDGWRTDRGRILRKYGEPTQVDESLASGDRRAYITWFYGAQQGGIYFYFVDFTGLRNYELVSSNARDEIYNPDWYQQSVIKTGQSIDDDY